MFLAPCFGYLGDRYNRKYIMSVGILFWALVTLASSFTPKEVSFQSWGVGGLSEALKDDLTPKSGQW